MNIYWWKDDQQLVAGLYSESKVTGYDWVLRDVIPVNLYVVESQSNINQPYAVTAIAGSESIEFGAKENRSDAAFLFSQDTWTPTGSGDSQRYVAEISLNTAELIAAIGSNDTIDVFGEFTIVQADGDNVLSTQFTIEVTRDIISGSDRVPTTEYPVIQQYTDDNDRRCVRIVNSNGRQVGLWKNGCPYVYEPSTQLWYPLTATIQDGQPTPAFGAGESS